MAAVALLVAGAFLLGFWLTRAAEPATGPATTTDVTPPQPSRLLEEVRSELASSYYRSIDPAVLRKRTVDGMIEALHDPHTVYLTPAEFQALEDRTEGNYSGIGLTVGPTKEGLLVTSAFAGPARAAGIRRGDVIVSIDGARAGRLGFQRSLALIKGEKGTIVHLRVRRPRRGTLEFTVMRREIDVPIVRAHQLQTPKGKVAYLHVLSFPAATADRIEQVLRRLVERGAKGAIVDLRDNPGGLLSEAVATVSLFVEEGLVCSTDGVHDEAREYGVSGDAAYPRLPLVVIVDRGSASAAEIVAAALRDHKRAVVVGVRTFGKASVQSIEQLTNGGALKVTTATYLTPAGEDISPSGIHPGVRALDDPLTRPDEALRAARKALLAALTK
ncbi:MAG: S41 family peptidase [Gaiellaceae bacterium]